MKWTIEYIESDNYFKVVNEGIYQTGDAVRLYKSLFSNKAWQPGVAVLFDNRQLDYQNVNYQVMSEASRRFADNEAEIGKSKIGYVVASQIGYGISRQFQMLMEGKSATRIEVFTDEERAVEWLTAVQTQ